jgi:MoaA/NifB/PqqE/SkfB family radical SAM enzyme
LQDEVILAGGSKKVIDNARNIRNESSKGALNGTPGNGGGAINTDGSARGTVLLRGNGDFTEEQYEEVLRADNEKRLMLSLGLTTGPGCNLRCIFCYNDGGVKEAGSAVKGQMTREDFKKAIKESAELGAQSVILSGIGETTMEKNFSMIVETIHDHGMYPLVFTNGTFLDRKMAKFLFANRASIYLSLNTTREETYNRITQTEGLFPLLLSGVENCLEAGFGTISARNGHQVTDFAVNTMLMKINAGHLDEIEGFCREKRLLFTCRLPERLGSTKEFWKTHIAATPAEEDEIRAAASNHSLGGEVFRTDFGCLFWVVGVLLGVGGQGRLCYSLNNKHDFGNIKQESMKEIIMKRNEIYPPKRQFFCPIHAELEEIDNQC